MVNLNLFWLDYVVKAVTEKFISELKAQTYLVIYDKEDGFLRLNSKVGSVNTVRLTAQTTQKDGKITFKLELLRLGRFNVDTEFKDELLLTYDNKTEETDNLITILDANSKISSKLSEWLQTIEDTESNTKSLELINNYLVQTLNKIGTNNAPNKFSLEIIVNTNEFDLSFSNKIVYIDAILFEGRYSYKEKHKGVVQ